MGYFSETRPLVENCAPLEELSKGLRGNHYLIYISIFIAAWLLHSCATPTAPQGGERDFDPPQIVEEESTPNFQTNFEKQTIELTFDEWVTLEKVSEEVVISPPLASKPEIKLKKRTVQVIFPDTLELKENATYTINFGEAVKDLNEKNPADDLRFVFATGPILDSLSISGRVVDAITGEPIEKSLVMLYENLADTVVRTELPFYFGKTDEDGFFEIENIREGTYKAFALEDAPGSKTYVFDRNTERLAFPDSVVVISPDTIAGFELRMFAEALPLQIKARDTSGYGRIKLAFNQPILDLELNYENIIDTPIVEIKDDTLTLWYDQETPWTLYAQQDTFLRDTLLIRAKSKASFLEENELLPAEGPVNVTITPGNSAVITYNHPLASFDTSLLKLYADTTREVVQANLQIDTLDPKRLLLDYNWKETYPYELEMLPGAVTDIFGLQTQDSLIINYGLDPIKKYGNILLSLRNLDTASYYLVQLVSKDLQQILKSDAVFGFETYSTQWSILKPADYTLRVVTDRNNNGRWDTGNYDQQLQPEPIYLRPMEKLRANWDLEVDIPYGEIIIEEEEEKPDPRGRDQGRGRSGRND